jgi:hypothetical protein
MILATSILLALLSTSVASEDRSFSKEREPNKEEGESQMTEAERVEAGRARHKEKNKKKLEGLSPDAIMRLMALVELLNDAIPDADVVITEGHRSGPRQDYLNFVHEEFDKPLAAPMGESKHNLFDYLKESEGSPKPFSNFAADFSFVPNTRHALYGQQNYLWDNTPENVRKYWDPLEQTARGSLGLETGINYRGGDRGHIQIPKEEIEGQNAEGYRLRNYTKETPRKPTTEEKNAMLVETIARVLENNPEHVEKKRRMLKTGRIQERLGVARDGIMGPDTRRAIRNFQGEHNLTVDGDPGPNTMRALFSLNPIRINISEPGRVGR